MATIGRAVVRVPKSASKGEVVKIQMVITHPMETGLRKDKKTGQLIPAHYITKVEFLFNGKKVTTLHTGAGVSKNPYFAIKMKVTESGTLTIKYEDNKGGKWEKSAEINVS
ncbi:sulfur compound chelating protein SoxZ [Hydrogenivirga caldilitoris]|uniref:Sulfur compound chelating protein SoxZ n=1 Tax=Hydrogenivirga caldilitoris TaxID=246264 RepID=A0A497XXE8_9AQUI|nr:thiosulfate oxidation carrier complex protein SoxZ [Hydrogenivirga caldilitoris]RLJ71443.1 sulfur compound chelating protein SoxZ [Hydrogenivirga caldilitoris]